MAATQLRILPLLAHQIADDSSIQHIFLFLMTHGVSRAPCVVVGTHAEIQDFQLHQNSGNCYLHLVRFGDNCERLSLPAHRSNNSLKPLDILL